MRTAASVVLTEVEQTTLTKWSRGRSTPTRVVLRAQDRAGGGARCHGRFRLFGWHWSACPPVNAVPSQFWTPRNQDHQSTQYQRAVACHASADIVTAPPPAAA